jgi:hypothetical protein
VTAPNHALTGALIGLTVSNPALALPLAFLSHFVLDALPHYDPPKTSNADLFRTRRFVLEFIVMGAGLCFALVLLLAVVRPAHWILAAVCAFVATVPDLLWLPRFLSARRTGKDTIPQQAFFQFHDRIQRHTSPRLLWFEIVWSIVSGAILLTRL